MIANDPTVKAGSWGRLTVEKIIRSLEAAYEEMLPVFFLVDSAGARITDQVDLFPGRRGAGKIFYNQIRLSGRVPQICCLFGPSAAGGAYIPSFCDVVVMVEGNASMYLGSPRMAKMVIGEETTLEEMGGARMHCEVSGCGDALVQSDAEAISWAQQYFSYVADHYRVLPPAYAAEPPAEGYLPAETLPDDPKAVYDMLDLLKGIFDDGSIFQIKELYAKGGDHSLCAARRQAGRDRCLTASTPWRCVVRRFGGQGGPVHVAVRRDEPSRCSTSQTCLDSWWAQRSSVRASSAREPRCSLPSPSRRCRGSR